MVWGDILTLEYGKPVPDKASPDGLVPVFGTNGQIGTSNMPPMCRIASFIVGRKGAYRGVHYSSVPFSVIDTAFYALPIVKTVNMKWAYYMFLTYDINRMDSGSAIPSTDRYEIYRIPVVLPSLQEQERVVSVLDAISDKMAMNTQINHHLEQMAQAVFTEQCSEGKSAVLSDILTVCYGKDHKHLGDGHIPCYGSGGIMRYVDKPLFSGESVLIPRKGSLNNVLYVNEAFWTVDTMFYTQMTRPNVAKVAYFIVRNINLAEMNVGSAVPSMTTAVLNTLEIVLPSDRTLASFEETVNPMFLQMQANNEESDRLAKLRDTLLPRLISGELSVAEIAAK